MNVLDAEADAESLAGKIDFVFCAVNMKKDDIKALEEKYAKLEIPVVSNNSAHRFTPDVPMVIPEINADHLTVIPAQRKRLGTKRGFIAVKSNCSLQSYVPLLHPLQPFGIKAAAVCTYQAISGAGKTFDTMPEILDNIIPYIGGEEEKSEKEPLKIWGSVQNGQIVPAQKPVVTAQCLRVPVTDGHTAAVFVSFVKESRRRKRSSPRGRILRVNRKNLPCLPPPRSLSNTPKRITVRRRSSTVCAETAWRSRRDGCAKTVFSTINSSGFRTIRCAARRGTACRIACGKGLFRLNVRSTRRIL